MPVGLLLSATQPSESDLVQLSSRPAGFHHSERGDTLRSRARQTINSARDKPHLCTTTDRYGVRARINSKFCFPAQKGVVVRSLLHVLPRQHHAFAWKHVVSLGIRKEDRRHLWALHLCDLLSGCRLTCDGGPHRGATGQHDSDPWSLRCYCRSYGGIHGLVSAKPNSFPGFLAFYCHCSTNPSQMVSGVLVHKPVLP